MEQTIRKARRLRGEMTRTEGMLWGRLRKRHLSGYRFRRQHPVGDYIADFACLQRRLLIEIDGPCHEDQVGDDRSRDGALRAMGFRLIRFHHWELEVDLNSVVKAIAKELEKQD
jgi:very-short-patch-repair endonuclease